MNSNNAARGSLLSLLCIALTVFVAVPSIAQNRYKPIKFIPPMTYCNVHVEEDMPQERIEYLWNTYGADSLYKYCFVTSFVIYYDNNHSFMAEFRSITPPETPQQVIPEEKYYLLSPDVVDFVRKLKSMYGNLSVLTYTAYYSQSNPGDSTSNRFAVELVGDDTVINLGLLHEQRKYAKSRQFDPIHQMRGILSGGCGELASVPNTESHTTEEPAIVRAVGVAPPMGTDAGQPFVIIDVRGRIVHSGTTTGGPSSDVIPLPAGVYAVITSTTRQRVLVVP
jgi:hypothetical protein